MEMQNLLTKAAEILNKADDYIAKEFQWFGSRELKDARILLDAFNVLADHAPWEESANLISSYSGLLHSADALEERIGTLNYHLLTSTMRPKNLATPKEAE